MLFGEHAVIYDKPCLVTAVDIRVYVAVEGNETKSIVVSPSNSDLVYETAVSELLERSNSYHENISFVMAGVERFYKRHNIREGIKIITYGPKNSFGLGSSSAVTVATLKALGEYYKISLSQRELFDLAYQSVIDVQGKGSGFDVAAAVYGGTIYFLTGGKIIEPLNVQKIPLIIGYSGKKVSTVNLVNEVKDAFQTHPTIIGGIFDTIQLIVEDAKQKLLNEHWDGVGQLSNINQGLLDALGVNTNPLAKIIFAARQAGALGAKLSGAGGGDCMFAIATTEIDKVKAAMSEAGAEIIEFAINADGARIEKGIPNYANE